MAVAVNEDEMTGAACSTQVSVLVATEAVRELEATKRIG